MFDDSIIVFLCEQRRAGHEGFIPSEVIRKAVNLSKSGQFAKRLEDLYHRRLLDRGIEVDGFRRFLYRVNEGVYDKWLISIMR